jgi:hypothetical protein
MMRAFSHQSIYPASMKISHLEILAAVPKRNERRKNPLDSPILPWYSIYQVKVRSILDAAACLPLFFVSSKITIL